MSAMTVERPPAQHEHETPIRLFHCPHCGRFVFKSTAEMGLTQHRCKSCKYKTWYDHATGQPRRVLD